MTGHMLGGERPPTGAVWWALRALYLFAALAEASGDRRVLAGCAGVAAAAAAASVIVGDTGLRTGGDWRPSVLRL